MSKKRLNIHNINDLPLLNLKSADLPDIIVFYSKVKIPLITSNDIITNITADPKMELRDEKPYVYRKEYIRTYMFNINFVEPEIKEKLEKLQKWLQKKDNKLYFCITHEIPSSFYNVLSYLGYLFYDYEKAITGEKYDIIKAPYPLKISAHSEDHPRVWIWSRYWPRNVGNIITYEKLSDENDLLEFPDDDDRFFPIKPLKKTKDGGVIAFSVDEGIQGGEVIVMPQYLVEKLLPNPDNEVTLYIEDIPKVLYSLKGGDPVIITLKYKKYNTTFEKANLFWFIRFMYIYYLTQKENPFQYKLIEKELVDPEFAEGTPAKKFESLLKSEHDEVHSNFPNLLKETKKRCIRPTDPPDEDSNIIEDLVWHQKRLPKTGFHELHLTNLKIRFSHKAWKNIQNIKIKGTHPVIKKFTKAHPVNKKFKEILPEFFNILNSIASCEEINE